MNPMSDFVSFVFIAQTTMLVITSLLLVYPVVAYARNVAYTRGLLALAGAFLVVTASYVASVPLGLSLVSAALDLVAALLAATGVWQFARPFVRFDAGTVEPSAAGGAGGEFGSASESDGFESAGDAGGVGSASDTGGFESAGDRGGFETADDGGFGDGRDD